MGYISRDQINDIGKTLSKNKSTTLTIIYIIFIMYIILGIYLIIIYKNPSFN